MAQRDQRRKREEERGRLGETARGALVAAAVGLADVREDPNRPKWLPGPFRSIEDFDHAAALGRHVLVLVQRQSSTETPPMAELINRVRRLPPEVTRIGIALFLYRQIAIEAGAEPTNKWQPGRDFRFPANIGRENRATAAAAMECLLELEDALTSACRANPLSAAQEKETFLTWRRASQIMAISMYFHAVWDDRQLLHSVIQTIEPALRVPAYSIERLGRITPAGAGDPMLVSEWPWQVARRHRGEFKIAGPLDHDSLPADWSIGIERRHYSIRARGTRNQRLDSLVTTMLACAREGLDAETALQRIAEVTKLLIQTERSRGLDAIKRQVTSISTSGVAAEGGALGDWQSSLWTSAIESLEDRFRDVMTSSVVMFKSWDAESVRRQRQSFRTLLYCAVAVDVTEDAEFLNLFAPQYGKYKEEFYGALPQISYREMFARLWKEFADAVAERLIVDATNPDAPIARRPRTSAVVVTAKPGPPRSAKTPVIEEPPEPEESLALSVDDLVAAIEMGADDDRAQIAASIRWALAIAAPGEDRPLVPADLERVRRHLEHSGDPMAEAPTVQLLGQALWPLTAELPAESRWHVELLRMNETVRTVYLNASLNGGTVADVQTYARAVNDEGDRSYLLARWILGSDLPLTAQNVARRVHEYLDRDEFRGLEEQQEAQRRVDVVLDLVEEFNVLRPGEQMLLPRTPQEPSRGSERTAGDLAQALRSTRLDDPDGTVISRWNFLVTLRRTFSAGAPEGRKWTEVPFNDETLERARSAIADLSPDDAYRSHIMFEALIGFEGRNREQLFPTLADGSLLSGAGM